MNITLTLIAQALVFASFIWFTATFVWPYMLRAIETRQKTIADGLAAALPYADAAFMLADAAGALGKWSEMLAALAQVAADERVRAAVADPKLSDARVAGLFIAILAGKLSGEAENFVRVLAQNKRLPLLPEIHAQFEALKNESEGVGEAEG